MNWKGGKIKRDCLLCKKKVFVAPHKKLQKNIFCSKKCANIFNGKLKIKNNRIMTICKNCGKKYFVRPFEKKNNLKIFCSIKCFQGNAEVAKKISKANKGRKFTEEHKKKIGEANKGKKSYMWKGGKPKCKVCGKTIGYSSDCCQKCKTLFWTDEHKRKIGVNASNILKGRMPKNIMRPGKFGNIKRGYFDINGRNIFFRSKWEANIALYLDFLVKQKEIKKWEYEKDVFIFEKIKFGTRSYRPDFKIYNNNKNYEYWEVKGWMTAKSKTQIKRMAKYYSDIKLIIIEEDAYNDIKKKVGRMLNFV